jgi:AcrR family transcriptional regulator
MLKDKSNAREKIIQTTTELIKEFQDINHITIRDIASKSEVGSGLINYHFQTKENLIGICVLRIISQFIEDIERLYENLDMTPIDKLKYVFKYKCAFIVENPIISKTSMILDLNAATLGDNTDQSSKVHFKVLKEICGDRKTDSELFIVLHEMMSSIQVSFLRNDVIKAHTNIDFFNKEQREIYIDSLIDRVIK